MAEEREQSIEAELRLKFPSADVEQIKKAAAEVARMRKEIEELGKAAEKTSQTVKRDFMGIPIGSATGVPASQFFGGGGELGGGGGGSSLPRMGGGRRPAIAGSGEDAARIERLERFLAGNGTIPPPGGGGPPNGGGGGGGGGNGGGGNGNPYSTRRDGVYELLSGHPIYAADRYFGFRGKLAIGAGLGIAATLGAAGARNAAFMADIRGQTGGDASRASLESNWFTRQGISAYDTISNRSGLMAQVGIQSQRADIAQQLRSQIGGELNTTDAQGRRVALGRVTGNFEADWNARRLENASRVRSFAQDPRVATMGYYDRSTVASEVAFREAQARQPIQARAFELSREGLAIGNEKAGTLAALAKTKDELRRVNIAAMNAGLRVGDDGGIIPNSAATDAKRGAALDEQGRLIKENTRLLELQQAQVAKIQELEKQGVENTREKKRNQLELVRLESQELAQRADKAEGQAGNIGQMTPLERQLNLNYLKAFLATEDKNMLPPEVIAGARRLAPETVEKAFVEFGAKDTAFNEELRRVAPGEYRDNVKDARRNAQAKANEARVLEVQFQKEFFQDIGKFTLGDDFKKEFEAVFRQLNANLNAELTRQLADFRQANKQ